MDGEFTLTIYDHPVDRVVKISDHRPVPHLHGAARGKVNLLSPASRRRLNHIARNYSQGSRTMVTLTYPGDPVFIPIEGTAVKRHLDRFLVVVRRVYPSARYLWWLEFQARGAPHFHIFFDWATETKEEREAIRATISKSWSRIVFADYQNCPLMREIAGATDEIEARENHEAAGTKVEKLRYPHAASAYISKECGAVKQKIIPDGFGSVGRWWGTSRGYCGAGPSVEEVGLGPASSIPALLCAAVVERDKFEAFQNIGLKVAKPERLKLQGARILNGSLQRPGRKIVENSKLLTLDTLATYRL